MKNSKTLLWQDCRALYVCREIANGSKHMRRKKADPDVKAKAEWHKAWEKVGVVNVGDYVMSMKYYRWSR